MICYIVGAGEFCESKFRPEEGAFVISADGGYRHLEKARVKPDLLIGDFDSLDLLPEGIETLRFPSEKDSTDMMLAAAEALRRGFRSILIFGGTGTRIDHTMANIQMIAALSQQGAAGTLICEEYNITAVSNSCLKFKACAGGTISVFCNGGEASGVYLRGLRYPLADATLTAHNPLGVSNEFIGMPSEVEVKNGTLIVVWFGGHDLLLD